MEQHNAILLSVVAVVAMGITGLNALQGDFGSDQATPLGTEGSSMLGHITLTVYDKNGDIKSYEQTDNVVTVLGINCAVSFLFENATVDGAGGAAEQCALTNGYSGFHFIAIGNASGVSVASDDTVLDSEMACNDGGNPGAGCNRTLSSGGNLVYTLAAAAGSSASVSLTGDAVFSFDDTTGTVVTEAGLFSTGTKDTGEMFAHQAFTSTVTRDDTLAVTWTITLGP